MKRPDVEFDDIIYHLQTNRGASVYWARLRLELPQVRPDWWIVSRAGHRSSRFAPVHSAAAVFHSSLFRLGFGRGVRNVMTVHDLAYERGLVAESPRAKVALAQRRLCVARADGLVFISETTRQEFAECYPRYTTTPSVVAWHGRDPDFDEAPPVDGDGLRPRPYLLHVGHRDGYKNFSRALRAYAATTLAKDGVQLVCVGPPLSPAERDQIRQLELTEDVVWVDAPTRRDLQREMSGAIALVYVSTYEGFGMPLVEAMQTGTAIVAGNTTCLPEIGGDVPVYVDPTDVDDIASAMALIANDDALRAERVALGLERALQFNWSASAELHAELYEQLGAGR